MKKSKSRENDKKNPAGFSDDVQQTEIIISNDVDDTRTRQFPQDQVMEGLQYPDPDGIEYKDPEQEEGAFSFRIKKKSPYRPLLLILGIVVLIFLALFVVQIIRSHRNSMVLKRATETKVAQESGSDFLESLERKSSRKEPVDMARLHLFSDDMFQGEAILGDEDQHILSSGEKDAELVAIGDAMNIRARILFPIKAVHKGDTLTETCSGNFHGFKITSHKVTRAENIIRDEITLSTPSRGLVNIAGKSLQSVSRTTYDRFLQDLEAAGLKAVKKVLPEKNLVQIQLRMVGNRAVQPDDPSLISGKGVGKVILNSEISEISSLLDNRYNMIKRRIMVENEFVIIYKVENQNRKPLFYIYERDNRIWGIQIVDELFRTEKGIGIGSSLGAMRIYYTKLNMVAIPRKITYLSVDQEHLNQIKFILADDARIDFTSKRFPFDIQINSILIGKSPYLN